MIKLRDVLKEIGIDLPPPNITLPPALHRKVTHDKGAEKPSFYQSNADFSKVKSNGSVADEAADLIKKFENSKDNPRGGFDKRKNKWFAIPDVSGKNFVIAYGHKVNSGENFRNGLTDAEALELLKRDVRDKINQLKTKITNFQNLPSDVQVAAVNASFRGDLGPKAMKLLSRNKLAQAAVEYLNNNEYRSTNKVGIKKRMEYNADVFKKFA